MTVWVIREGRLVDKASIAALDDRRSIFPSPRVSRMETFESPVTGKDISSWRERDRDMHAADAVDPRDLPRKPFEERARKNGRRTDHSTFKWTDTDSPGATGTGAKAKPARGRRSRV